MRTPPAETPRSLVRFCVAALTASSLITPAEGQTYHVYEHPDRGGNHWAIDGTGLRGANLFHEDSISAIDVPDGYILTIAEDDWLKGYQTKIVGYCPFTGSIRKEDGEDWDNEINSMDLQPLPEGWNAEPNLKTGIYLIHNPYNDCYLHESDGTARFGVERHGVEPTQERFRVFVVRDPKKNTYRMFSVTSGKSFSFTNRMNDQGQLEPALQAEIFDAKASTEMRLMPVGNDLFMIASKDAPQLALSTKVDRYADVGPPLFRQRGKETNQQWRFILKEEVVLEPSMQPETLTETTPPHYTNYRALQYNDQNRTSEPHLVKTVDVPFYMVPDPDLDFAGRMERSPTYRVKYEKVVKQLWPNGWVMNGGTLPRSFEYVTQVQTTEQKGGSTHAAGGASLETEISSSVPGIVDVSVTMGIWAEFGMTKDWFKNQSHLMGQTLTYNLGPGEEGCIFALANRISVYRGDSLTKQWALVSAQEVLEDGAPHWDTRPISSPSESAASGSSSPSPVAPPEPTEPATPDIFRERFLQIEGSFSDIALGPGGEVFAIGVDKLDHGHDILVRINHDWHTMVGAALRVAVDSQGVPWVIDANHMIYRYESGWKKQPGLAKEIATGSDGSVVIIGMAGSIYRWNGTDWHRLDQQALKVAVDPQGSIWAISLNNELTVNATGLWTPLAKDVDNVAIGGGTIYVSGAPTGGPRGLYVIRSNTSGFELYAECWLTEITVSSDGKPWVIDASNQLWFGN